MEKTSLSPPKLQSLTMEKFLYHFLGMRKGEIRRRVKLVKERHPGESPEQLARRMVAGHMPLSLVGAAVLHVPMFVPGIGPLLKGLGVAGGAATLVRLHTALIMEIALLFGRNIDEKARLKEIWAVMAMAGLATASPFLVQRFGMKPLLGISTGLSAVSAISEIVGEVAIQYYKRTSPGQPAEEIPSVEPSKAAVAASVDAPAASSDAAKTPARKAAAKAGKKAAPKAASKAASQAAPAAPERVVQ